MDTFVHSDSIKPLLMSVDIEGAVVVERGNEVHITFPDLSEIDIEYTWDAEKHLLTASFWWYDGVISYSFFIDAWETNPALEFFYRLVEAARDSLEQRTPPVLYVYITNQYVHIYREEEYRGSFTFKVTILPKEV